MNETENQALPGIDLDKLEAEVRSYETFGYVRARIVIADALALIAQARANQSKADDGKCDA